MSELPPGITLEETWLIEATYAPEAVETRGSFRAEHLGRIVELREAGVVIEAGGLADFSASILVVRADSEDAALAIVRDDVYMANGVWVEVRARKFIRVT